MHVNEGRRVDGDESNLLRLTSPFIYIQRTPALRRCNGETAEQNRLSHTLASTGPQLHYTGVFIRQGQKDPTGTI